MGVKKFVKLFGYQNRKILIDIEATKGATVGTDLAWPDGSIVQEDEIRNSASSGGSSSSGSTVIGGTTTEVGVWKYIVGIPDIIKSLAGLTDTGWLRSTAGVISALDWPFVRKTVQSAESFTIPANFQLIVVDEFFVDGEVVLDGELVVL